MKPKLTLLYLTFLSLPLAVNAQGNTLDKLKKVGDSAYGSDPVDPKDLIGNIVQIILGFVGFIFVVLIVMGGFQWMTSAGNEEKITSAKRLIRNATIGLTLIFIAYAIAYSITTWLGEAVSEDPGTPAPTP